MACFRPNLVEQKVDEFGVVHSTFRGSAKFLDPREFDGIDDLSAKGKRQVLVPCGCCIGCKIDYSHEWSSRLCIEYEDNDRKAIFLTLTYNDTHLPVEPPHGFKYLYENRELLDIDIDASPVLCVRDCQLFMKRLRKKFSDKKIRFYLAGEYGPSTNRPHYHAIIFGLTLQDFDDLTFYKYNRLKQPLYKSRICDGIWKNGFTVLADVSMKTCAYVARYCCKKYFRLLKEDFCPSVPEFTLCSRRPGIGFLRACELVDSEITKYPFSDMNGVSFYYLPKAVFNKGILEVMESDFEKASRLVYARVKSSEDIDLLGFDSFDVYLEHQEKVLLKKLKLLKDGEIE